MVIEPGYTATHLQSHWKPEQKEMLKAMTQPVQPEDIARAVAFLVADEADFITGATLSVNGGQHMY